MKYSANSVWENKDQYDVAVIGPVMQGVRRLWRVHDLVFVQLYLLSV